MSVIFSTTKIRYVKPEKYLSTILLLTSMVVLTPSLPSPIISLIVAEGSTSTIEVYPVDSKPYGLSYAEWSAKWWQWVHSISAENNPVTDTTGKECARGQNGPVWFLAGTYGGPVERTCNIPAGKAIFIPIANIPCSPANPEFESLKGKPESVMRQECKKVQDSIDFMEIAVDGMQLPNLGSFRVQSPLFNLTMPENNVFGVAQGTYPTVGDGNYQILKPLPPGEHDISWVGADIEPGEQAMNVFANEVTYHLNILP